MKKILESISESIGGKIIDMTISSTEKITEVAPYGCLFIFSYEPEYPSELFENNWKIKKTLQNRIKTVK